MHPSKSLICLLFSIVLLAGCSHFQSDDESDAAEGGGEKIVLYDQGQEQPRQPLSQMDLSPTVLSSGNVQVYSLDGAAPAGSGGYSGAIVTNDPSVQVFPLDDEMARAMGLGHVSSGMPAVNVGSVEQVDLGAGMGPAPVPLPAATVNDGVIRVYFDHDSSKVNESAVGAIAAAVEKQQAGPDTVLKVEGHASTDTKTDDPVKRRIINLKVSMDRAFAVAKSLMEKGVPAEKIKAVGRGDTQPSAPVEGMDAAAASRRVEISSVSGQ